MIVVVGIPCFRLEDDAPAADGLASRIARAAVIAGGAVQLVGKVGDDPAGDAILIDLARAGVGHAALLRDPANPTRVFPATPPAEGVGGDGRGDGPEDLLVAAALLVEPEPSAEIAAPPGTAGPGPTLEPADLELGLRYLVEFGVVVVADPPDARSAGVVADAAAWAGAHVIALLPSGDVVPAALAGATVLEIPPEDPDDAFARLVASYAVALDAGADPGEAFQAAAEGGGWEPARS